VTEDHNSTTASSPGYEVPPIASYFELREDDHGAEGLCRIAREQVELATWHARRVGAADEHVHEVRRATKRVRALLRMVRDRLGEQSYRHDNAVLRDVARDLSALRSATIRVTTLEMLARSCSPIAASVEGLHVQLSSEMTALRASVGAGSPLADDLVDRLQSATASVGEWTLPPALIFTAPGLQRTYRRGRLGMERVYADQSTDRLHAWRKRVKYLRHQMEIFGAVLPESMQMMAGSLRELGEGLGMDHDLADIESVVLRSPDVFSSPTAQGEMLDVIAHRRRELQADLLPLGKRLYAQTPGDFVRVMTSYWEERDDLL
jgi:CHAD domain-containing protein